MNACLVRLFRAKRRKSQIIYHFSNVALIRRFESVIEDAFHETIINEYATKIFHDK